MKSITKMGKAWKRKNTPPEISGCKCAPSEQRTLVPKENHDVVPASREYQAGEPVPIVNQTSVQKPIPESTASSSLKKDVFLEQLLETMRSLKETQERQGE